MISAGGVTDAFLFEWKRLMKFPRVAWWFALAAFPPVIVALPQIFSSRPPSSEDLFIATAMASYLTLIACMLGLLLIATPVVYAELEGKTWTYLSVRPNGKSSMLLGKYLAAVAWSTAAAWAGLLACRLLTEQHTDTQLWVSMVLLVPLQNFAIGAALVLFGVLGLRRAMVFGLLYCLVFEFAISNIPAIISRLTAVYHVRTLWFKAAGIPPDPNIAALVGQGTPFLYVGALLAYAFFFLGTALNVLSRRQLVTHQED